MKLIDALSPHFSHNSQARGAEYAASGRVRILDRSDHLVRAVVRGSVHYDVDLSFDGGTLVLSCTCPHFEDFNPCKHLWATALALTSDPSFANWPGLAPEVVEFDFQGFDDDGFGDDGFDNASAFGDSGGADRYPPPGSPGGASQRRGASTSQPQPERPTVEPWRPTLQRLRSNLTYEAAGHRAARAPSPDMASGDIFFLIGHLPGGVDHRLILNVMRRVRKKNGDWSKQKLLRLEYQDVAWLPDPAFRQVVAMLVGASGFDASWGYGAYGGLPLPASFAVPAELGALVFPILCETGGCLFASIPNAVPAPVEWDPAEPWTFHLALEPADRVATTGVDSAKPDAGAYRLAGFFRRGTEQVSAAQPQLVTKDFLVIDHRVSRVEADDVWPWISFLSRERQPAVPAADVDRFLEVLFTLPSLPAVEFPARLGVTIEDVAPVFCLKLIAESRQAARAITARLSFDYGGMEVPAGSPGVVIYRPEERRGLRRDMRRERAAAATLKGLGFSELATWSWAGSEETKTFAIDAARVPAAVTALVEAGWRVEGDGKVYRPFVKSSVSVRSGIDWFELHGDVQFGDQVAHLPELLRALSHGERLIALGDGSVGLLPEEWLKRFAGIAGFGESEGDHVRFRPTQAALLDALLAAQPNVDVDAGFERARAELRRFGQVVPADAPPAFAGALRGYQRDGLGWLQFLRAFGFGGCLADDMGLGKTVMVLALLESVRAASSGRSRPSLVVAPRSVVFNWQREAERFTPSLRVADYTGGDRGAIHGRLDQIDLLITSYGTLRQDAVRLKDVDFEYVILDEAQAIKNPSTVSAKAARLLRGRHRLALSGTPIENHVGELWSIFEFLNPGMLGSGAIFKPGAAMRKAGADDQLRLLGGAVRPFILRRTKSQVASDLPARQEETLWCELDAGERRLYDQLRAHYRAVLLGRGKKGGLGRAKLQVLEALLRLRQAACHPGLLDPAKAVDGSAKFEALTGRLAQVLEEGHKAIVFSQFTSLLALLRRRLDGERVPYEYLDGKTRDREALVERFQHDARSRLFLISLKAGGLGLNLTAADYVFLLDPWWNPAAEAQAIDRAHRIGQTRPVFAYRLIARDTVEERILELQQQKRHLADAIITEDNSVIANLTREELERLLG